MLIITTLAVALHLTASHRRVVGLADLLGHEVGMMLLQPIEHVLSKLCYKVHQLRGVLFSCHLHFVLGCSPLCPAALKIIVVILFITPRIRGNADRATVLHGLVALVTHAWVARRPF